MWDSSITINILFWVDIIPLISVSFHPSTSLIKRDKAMPSAIFITMKYTHTHTHTHIHPCHWGLGRTHYNETHIDKQTSNQTPAFNPVVLNGHHSYSGMDTHTHTHTHTHSQRLTSSGSALSQFDLVSPLIDSSNDFNEPQIESVSPVFRWKKVRY